MTTLNHIRSNESVNDKQLIIINSNERDHSTQDTNSFTYTFSKPIERITKVDVISSKIDNTFYNVDNNNSTMSITTKSFIGDSIDLLSVKSDDFDKGIISASNIIDGTIQNYNRMTVGNNNINTIKLAATIINLYVLGIYTGELNFYDITDINVNKSLTSVGYSNIYIAKYTLEPILQARFKIAGILDIYNPDIAVSISSIVVSGIYGESALNFYN